MPNPKRDGDDAELSPRKTPGKSGRITMPNSFRLENWIDKESGDLIRETTDYYQATAESDENGEKMDSENGNDASMAKEMDEHLFSIQEVKKAFKVFESEQDLKGTVKDNGLGIFIKVMLLTINVTLDNQLWMMKRYQNKLLILLLSKWVYRLRDLLKLPYILLS